VMGCNTVSGDGRVPSLMGGAGRDAMAVCV